LYRNGFRCLLFYAFLKLQVDQLREAVEELYYFEFVLDEIPIWGFVGYMEESGFLPHSHKVSFYVSITHSLAHIQWPQKVFGHFAAILNGCISLH